jgi:lipoate-protein ligase A
VFHEDTVAFAWAVPDASPRERIRERFEEVAALVVATLIKLGVEARVGEVPGEYCPGEWSVNARGRAKLMGVGQRVVRAATHVGGVIVVGGADRVRDVLVPVYRALEFPWDPATTGSIDAEIGAVDVDIVADAFAHEVGLVHDLGETPLDPALLRASEERRDEFTPPG